MPSDSEADDPLLRAIAALRADVNRLIDEQIASVRDRVEELVPPRPPRPLPAPVRDGDGDGDGTEPPEEGARVRPLDPRQRLDALARHLDHRLRLANVPPPERTEREATPEG